MAAIIPHAQPPASASADASATTADTPNEATESAALPNDIPTADARPASAPLDLSADGDMPEPLDLRLWRMHAARRARVLRTPAPVGPAPLPEANLALPIAGIHTAVAVVSALSGSVLLLLGHQGGLWPLTLAAIAGIGGWLGYVLSQRPAHARAAGRALLFSQIGIIGWSMALLGPRPALLALAPVLALLALRLVGRPAAIVATFTPFALYAALSLLSSSGSFHASLPLSSNASAVVDGAVLFVGLLAFLLTALDLHARRAKAVALAAAHDYELRTLRAQMHAFQGHIHDDSEWLRLALRAAQAGRPIKPGQVEGPLSPLAQDVEALAVRLLLLQSEHAEHNRLSQAVRRLARALESAWMGLPWDWPDPSDTALDDVVALLRTPNPRDAQSIRTGAAMPPIVPIPSRDPTSTPPPWEEPKLHPLSPLTGLRSSSTPSQESGPLPVPTRAASPAIRGPRQSALPWDEWNTWRTWDESTDE
jgi:hypothetical protein